MLGHALSRISRYIADGNAAFLGLRNVNIIISGSKDAYEFYGWTGIHHIRCDLAFARKHSFAVAYPFYDLILTRSVINGQGSSLSYPVP